MHNNLLGRPALLRIHAMHINIHIKHLNVEKVQSQ